MSILNAITKEKNYSALLPELMTLRRDYHELSMAAVSEVYGGIFNFIRRRALNYSDLSDLLCKMYSTAECVNLNLSRIHEGIKNISFKKHRESQMDEFSANAETITGPLIERLAESRNLTAIVLEALSERESLAIATQFSSIEPRLKDVVSGKIIMLDGYMKKAVESVISYDGKNEIRCQMQSKSK